MSPAKKQNDYCFTSFLYPKKPKYDGVTMEYICYGLETCPDTGRLHWQGFVQFRTPTSMKQAQLQTECKNSHFEERDGTPEEARVYCTGIKVKKNIHILNEVFIEFGKLVDRPIIEKTLDTSKFFPAIREGLTKLEAYDQYPALMVQRPRLYDDYKLAYRNSFKRKFDDDNKPVLEFHIGPSGSGKSRGVFAANPDAYVWSLGNGGSSSWLDNYEGQDVIILDDFDPKTISFSAMKQIAGYNPFSFQSKNGIASLVARKFIFTSTIDPYLWYPDPNKEWARRIKEFGIMHTYLPKVTDEVIV